MEIADLIGRLRKAGLADEGDALKLAATQMEQIAACAAIAARINDKLEELVRLQTRVMALAEASRDSIPTDRAART